MVFIIDAAEQKRKRRPPRRLLQSQRPVVILFFHARQIGSPLADDVVVSGDFFRRDPRFNCDRVAILKVERTTFARIWHPQIGSTIQSQCVVLCGEPRELWRPRPNVGFQRADDSGFQRNLFQLFERPMRDGSVGRDLLTGRLLRRSDDGNEQTERERKDTHGGPQWWDMHVTKLRAQ